jgi:hypothetical protein
MRTMVKMVCEYCNKEFDTPIEEYKRLLNGKKKHACCSKICANRLTSRNNRGENNIKYNSIIKECEYCGKKYKVNKCEENISKYCCKECMGKAKTKKSTIFLHCQYCGKLFPVLMGQLRFFKELKYCSNKCRAEVRKKRVNLICVICGKSYWEHLAYSKKSVCCSDECRYKWLSIYSNKPENLERFRKQGAKSCLNQKRAYTLPEKMVLEYLIKNNVEFEPQYPIGEILVVDFFLPEYNCILEVYGDYWHVNPLKYGEGKRPINKMQLRNKQKDIRRYKVLTKKYNYNFYSLWENDIKNNLEETMNKFFNYIESKIRRE